MPSLRTTSPTWNKLSDDSSRERVVLLVGAGSSVALVRRRLPPRPQPHLGHAAGGAGSRGAPRARNGASAMQPAGQDPKARVVPGTVTVPLCSGTNASPFWIMLLLVWGRLDNGMIPFWQPEGVAGYYSDHWLRPLVVRTTRIRSISTPAATTALMALVTSRCRNIEGEARHQLRSHTKAGLP